MYVKCLPLAEPPVAAQQPLEESSTKGKENPALEIGAREQFQVAGMNSLDAYHLKS